MGTVLLAHLANIARENKCKRMQWQALDWNEPARNFYKTFSNEMSDWITYRMDEKDIENFIEKHKQKLGK
jgi:hypothetical protein